MLIVKHTTPIMGRMLDNQHGISHLLLQVRTQVLNENLEESFRTWYPGYRPQPQRAAACPPGI